MMCGKISSFSFLARTLLKHKNTYIFALRTNPIEPMFPPSEPFAATIFLAMKIKRSLYLY